MKDKIMMDDYKMILAAKLPWKNLSGKTILITGANGFIPAYIIKFIFYLNDQMKYRIKIIGIARNKNRVEKTFREYKNRGDFRIIIQDISQPVGISEKINFIIHAASQASPKYYSVDPVGTLKANVLGTYNLLELARVNPVESLLLISAGETYGNIKKPGLTTEKDYGALDPAEVRSCYAESKRIGETMCVAWQHQYKVPAKIVRLYHTYGPGIKLDDGRVFADFISNIVNKQNIILKSDGRAIRSFIYIADTVAGLLTVLLKGKNGEAYNLANEKAITSIKKLARTLVDLFPEKKLKVVFAERLKGDIYMQSKIAVNKPNALKLRNLGWEPFFSIKDGFLRTIRSFM